jgi:hypothetical protein
MRQTYACTADRFEHDTRNHQLSVLRNDGVNRHLRFERPGDSSYRVDLITWDGRLCIDSDCGTFVFARIPDMFDFFRRDGREINPSYWQEKAIAIGTHEGVEEWSGPRFKRAVVKHFRDWWRGRGEWTEARQCFRMVRHEVLSRSSSGDAARHAIFSFPHEKFGFEDFFYDGSCTDYTFHFIWCCRAIVWGIQQFDKHQAAEAAPEAA